MSINFIRKDFISFAKTKLFVAFILGRATTIPLQGIALALQTTEYTNVPFTSSELSYWQ